MTPGNARMRLPTRYAAHYGHFSPLVFGLCLIVCLVFAATDDGPAAAEPAACPRPRPAAAGAAGRLPPAAAVRRPAAGRLRRPAAAAVRRAPARDVRRLPAAGHDGPVRQPDGHASAPAAGRCGRRTRPAAMRTRAGLCESMRRECGEASADVGLSSMCVQNRMDCARCVSTHYLYSTSDRVLVIQVARQVHGLSRPEPFLAALSAAA